MRRYCCQNSYGGESDDTQGGFCFENHAPGGPSIGGTDAQVRSQKGTAIGTILELTEETIIYTDLHWTQSMPSRFMAAWVGQFLTGHFPTAVYLHRFGHPPSPFCVGCGVLDMREHLSNGLHTLGFP